MKVSSLGTKRPRRGISFSAQVSQVIGTVLPREDFSAEEKSCYWWTMTELQQFRSNAHSIVHIARQEGESIRVHLIDDSYKTARDVERLNQNAVTELLQDPSLYTHKLETWNTVNDTHSGLERMSSQFQRMERRADCTKLKGKVLQIAKYSSWEEIAAASARRSLRSRFYARMVGHAHSQALISPSFVFVTEETAAYPIPAPVIVKTVRTKKSNSWSRFIRLSKSVASI